MNKFKNGNKKGKGRPKGSKNKRTEQWEMFSEWMMNEGLVKFKTELCKLEGKEYVSAVSNMMEYFAPKKKRTEPVCTPEKQEIIVQVTRCDYENAIPNQSKSI
jgi:hypothetical protein